MSLLRITFGGVRRVVRSVETSAPMKPSQSHTSGASVPGLSEKVILPTSNQELGPGAKKDGEYKNPEYFSYDVNSYFEAEIEMQRFRLPQPSAVKSN